MAAFWNRGIDAVPVMTGASHLMDGRDLVDLCEKLALPYPIPTVLDVGCGTGRVAAHCAGYHGVDIAADAVAYCARAGVQASVIDGPDDLPAGPFEWVVCLSVFTHVDRPMRQAYLASFASRAPHLLVDVIPGDGGGDLSHWSTETRVFVEDLAAAGYRIVAETDRFSPQAVRHHYYRAERAA